MNRIVQEFTKDQQKTDIPELAIGDGLEVGVRITEGERERIQTFAGTLIAMNGSGITRSITVRRIVSGEGVECVFPLHSPKINSIEVVRHGVVRRAKLYYLRDRIGKAVRLKERRVMKKKAD